MTLLDGKAVHQWGKLSILEGGGGLLGKNAEGEFQIDELYNGYRNFWLEVVARSNQVEVQYLGLSSGNGSILLSTNARPLPGLQWKTRRPLLV